MSTTTKTLLWLVATSIFGFALACGSNDGDPPPPTELCGTRAHGPCTDPAQVCYFTEGQCGRLDRGGVCAVPPEGCTQQYDPVCGCDGQTYGNTCTARAAGVSVDYKGECNTQSSCQAQDCGPIPPIAPPQQCPDGSEEKISMDCRPDQNGQCHWNIERGQCPNGCGPDACGPPPPIAPPQQCADGSEEQVSMDCKLDNSGQCNWDIQRSGCPTTCQQADCGPLPPIAPPMQCADGSEEKITIECNANTNNQCAWDIQRDGCMRR